MGDVILLVGHGSREKSGNTEIETFAAEWRKMRPNWLIQVCFIEFAVVLLDAGLKRAAQSGSRVIVVPLILNAAGHVKMEIPQHIAQTRAQFPEVEFLYTPHLGASDPILKILKRRLNHAMNQLDMPDPSTTGVILLGRGASDRMANGEVAKMARWIQEDSRHELVDIAFTGITYPRLERVVQRQVLLGMTQVVVLPYYLYTGTLIERIARQVSHLRQQYPLIRFAQSQYFGFEKEIYELLEGNVEAALQGQPDAAMPCDGCKYREVAQEHGFGHSHAHTADHAEHTHDHPAVQGIFMLHSEAPSTTRVLQSHAPRHMHDHAHQHSHDHDSADDCTDDKKHEHEHGHHLHDHHHS